MKSRSLFAQLLFVFFTAAVFIAIGIFLSFHYLANRPYKESFEKNIITYTNLIADKIRFDPLARVKIESNSGIKIYSTPIQMRRLLKQEKKLRFKRISNFVSVTKPGAKFFVRYDNGFDTFIMKIKDQNYYPEKLDAIFVALLLVVFIILFTYYKVQKIFNPLKEIQKITKEYGEGRFDQQIPNIHPGQLNDLINSINTMSTKIKDMLDSKRDLLLAIGHEIKTPLARLRMQTEMCSDKSNQSMIKNINEINSIIDTLLEAEKVANHKNLIMQEVAMEEFLNSYSKDNVKVSLNFDNLVMFIDPVRIDLVIKNIIHNSAKYAPGSDVDIKATLEDDQLLIELRDYGKGVNDEKLHKLTDAFYRPDDSRCRNTGGVGLGLHLVNNVITSHKGTVSFKNCAPGFEVLIKLPTISS
ncbi:MAG: HAMP domain-containing histidine kinase [Bacteriovoracaceae bacterium]|jgi:signal transduction histidine kinase|nr:HAMP domain-containing histidine kinase [Bacteriovoracaceae bacterium]